ncbi:hypothetical protein OTB20_36450 [Streptomyces sp. H27-H1]|uniref:hypothetical protein n=1 Tax=Streptomyces sp. H27-H1 TaxID=2996461 RepID=UPI00226D4E20|nr:hypothetical protein [Streptomyces sp. H27-H1]MCY0931584.1 hypothetical protein [Streptomyces sp. H27-H1]
MSASRTTGTATPSGFPRPESGFLLAHGEEDPGTRFNQEWERLARGRGLFSAAADGRPEFLLGVDIAQDDSGDSELQSWRWVRVALADHWDIAGTGFAFDWLEPEVRQWAERWLGHGHVSTEQA